MRRKRRILIIGAGREQTPAISKACQMGFEVFATDMNPAAPGFRYADKKFVVSTSDFAGNLEVAQNNRIHGVMTLISETGVPVVAGIAESLGLPGISKRTALWATDKIAMRERLKRKHVPQPKFCAPLSSDEFQTALSQLNFPIVIKPAVNSGQRGITKVTRYSDIIKAYEEAKSYSSDGRVLIEEYVQGKEINVTALVIRRNIHILSLSDRLTLEPPAFGVAYAHRSPAQIKAEEIKDVMQCASRAICALDMDNGIAYPQILIGPKGAQLIEIAARIPGGNMREVALYTSGIDLIEAAILQSMGSISSYSELPKHPSYPAVYVRFLTTEDKSLPIGKVKSISGIKNAKSLPGVKIADIHIKLGEKIQPVRHSTHRYGVTVSVGDNQEAVANIGEKALKLIKIEAEKIRM